MKVITFLPYPVQIRIGASIGALAHLLARKRRHITEVNIDLCFPSWSALRRAGLVRDTFRSSGIGLIETANSWISNPKRFSNRFNIEGLDNLQKALDGGKGVLLLGMHFSTLDLCGAVLSSYIGFDVMYRRNKNKLLEAIMTRGRIRNFPNAIARDDVRRLLKNLKTGHAVWYGPDQDYGRRHSLFAPFFGIETATIKATARIAKISGSPVIIFTHRRTSDDQGYVLNLSEPLAHFPSDDELADATLINSLIEKAIESAPEQYWWVHRRFKTRPPGESRPY